MVHHPRRVPRWQGADHSLLPQRGAGHKPLPQALQLGGTQADQGGQLLGSQAGVGVRPRGSLLGLGELPRGSLHHQPQGTLAGPVEPPQGNQAGQPQGSPRLGRPRGTPQAVRGGSRAEREGSLLVAGRGSLPPVVVLRGILGNPRVGAECYKHLPVAESTETGKIQERIDNGSTQYYKMPTFPISRRHTQVPTYREYSKVQN